MRGTYGYQHQVFTSLQAAEAFAEVAAEGIDADETIVIVPDAAARKFIVSLRANGEHVMYV